MKQDDLQRRYSKLEFNKSATQLPTNSVTPPTKRSSSKHLWQLHKHTAIEHTLTIPYSSPVLSTGRSNRPAPPVPGGNKNKSPSAGSATKPSLPSHQSRSSTANPFHSKTASSSSTSESPREQATPSNPFGGDEDADSNTFAGSEEMEMEARPNSSPFGDAAGEDANVNHTNPATFCAKTMADRTKETANPFEEEDDTNPFGAPAEQDIFCDPTAIDGNVGTNDGSDAFSADQDTNPFGSSPVEATNPFGGSSDNNPFGSSSDSNHFGSSGGSRGISNIRGTGQDGNNPFGNVEEGGSGTNPFSEEENAGDGDNTTNQTNSSNPFD